MATVRTFSAAVLKNIKVEHSEAAFLPKLENGFWRSPKFSLRRQAELRKACLLNNIEPESIGMPPPKPQKIMQKKPPKGHKQQRLYEAKRAEIQMHLDKMPEKIQKWKKDLAIQKEKEKSSLPF
ncbi:hypothetical protein H4R24_002401 [Coemansia sp. RSA 988]|nr:hypothetical protein H4R24_002401 [Coemansia sp. RSA 988]